MIFVESKEALIETAGDLSIKRVQEIPEDFLKGLSQARDASRSVPAGDMHRVASVPTSLVDHWRRQGFDVFTASAKDIVARLKHESLDAFVTSDKL